VLEGAVAMSGEKFGVGVAVAEAMSGEGWSWSGQGWCGDKKKISI